MTPSGYLEDNRVLGVSAACFRGYVIERHPQQFWRVVIACLEGIVAFLDDTYSVFGDNWQCVLEVSVGYLLCVSGSSYNVFMNPHWVFQEV